MNALSPAQAVAALVSTTALTPALPDATLGDVAISILADRWHATEREWDELFDQNGGDINDPELARLADQQSALCDRIRELGCRSIADMLAVAGILATSCTLMHVEDQSTSSFEKLVPALVQDLMAVGDADAELIAAAHEFCRQADRVDACDYAALPGTRRARRATAEQKREIDKLYSIGTRMAGMTATTLAGLGARAMAIGRNDPLFSFAYDSSEGSGGKIMLAPLLRDGHALATSLPIPSSDAALLALAPEFERLLAAVKVANECPADDCDMPVFQEFDHFCLAVTEMPPAITAKGRAFQAAAAVHQLSYVANPPQPNGRTDGGGAAWRVLAGIVGDAYPLPGAAADDQDMDADAALLGLKPEIERLHEEMQAALQKNPARGGKKATRRRFDELVAQAVRMPKARTAAGLEFQQRTQWLAQARGAAVVGETSA